MRHHAVRVLREYAIQVGRGSEKGGKFHIVHPECAVAVPDIGIYIEIAGIDACPEGELLLGPVVCAPGERQVGLGYPFPVAVKLDDSHGRRVRAS